VAFLTVMLSQRFLPFLLAFAYRCPAPQLRERFRMLFFKNSTHLGHYFHMRNPVTKLMRYSIFAIQRIVEPKELKGRGNNPHSGGTSVQFNMIVWGMKPSR